MKFALLFIDKTREPEEAEGFGGYPQIHANLEANNISKVGYLGEEF